MKYEWIKAKIPGIRYREHPTRKHGIRKDRYYTIRYKLDGKTKEEALGWESEGWNESKVAARLHELKENQRTGDREVTLSAKKEKTEKSCRTEEGLFKKWLCSAIGNIPMKEISPFALERLKDKMKKANLSPRSIFICYSCYKTGF